MWPAFDSRIRRQMWVEFVVGFRPFLRVLRFSPLLKNQHFQIPIRSGIQGPQVCQSYLFIYLWVIIGAEGRSI